ncbi:hypothetical protein ACWEKJ_10730 [Amycolatopsis thermoflava]
MHRAQEDAGQVVAGGPRVVLGERVAGPEPGDVAGHSGDRAVEAADAVPPHEQGGQAGQRVAEGGISESRTAVIVPSPPTTTLPSR